MPFSDRQIYDLALDRIARIFNVNRESLLPNMVFGKDLRPRKKILFFFGGQELTDVAEDINFVTTTIIRKKRTKDFFGDIDIEKICAQTVDEYCKHMVKCYVADQHAVEDVLRC